MAQLAPVPSLLVLCLVFSNKKSVTKWKYSLEEVIQGPVASDHGWLVTSFRPGRFGGEMPGFEAIRGQEPYTAHFQHPAIFWHFCGNFRMSRGAFRNYWVEAGTKNEPKRNCASDPKNGSENRSSRFEPKISLISFLSGSGPLLRKILISKIEQ